MQNQNVKSQISIDEIKGDLSWFLQKLESGEIIIITKAGNPMAEIKPLAREQRKRPFGLCKGEFKVPDNFDDPLPEDIIMEFESQ